MDEPQKILVIIVARIGDTLLATPVIRSLARRFPAAKISVLAHPGRKAVLEQLPFIHHLGQITKKSAPFKGRMPGRPYDLCLLYSKDQALRDYALRVSRRVISFAHDDRVRQSMIETVAPPREAIHAVNERLMLLDPLGIVTPNLRLAYRIMDCEREWAERWIADHFDSRPARLIGLQPMSFPTKPYRNWPLEHFSALIDKLAERYSDTGFILLGDQDCHEGAQALCDKAGISIVSSCGKLSLRQSAALMGQLDLYVGVDTGPTHIAGALEIAMVAIYHCYHPGRLLKPLQRQDLEVIEHGAYTETCSRDTPIASVPVETVTQACLRLLEARPGNKDDS